jgi:hypothetical protein
MKNKELLFLVLLIYSSIALTAHIGFDLRDEGYHYFGYNRNQPIFFEFSAFQFIIRIFPYSDDIVYNRMYKILLLISGAFIFSYALYKTYLQNIDLTEIFIWACLGNSLTYVIGPGSLSYNQLNLFFLEVSLSIHIVFLANYYRMRKIKKFILLITFSFFLSLIFLNKLTSAILFFIFILIDTYYFYKSSRIIWIKFILTISILSLLFTISFFGVLYGRNFEMIYEYIIQSISSNDKHFNVFFLIENISLKIFNENSVLLIFLISNFFLIYFKKKITINSLGLLFYYSIFVLLFICSFVYYHKFYYNTYTGSQYFYSFFIIFLIFNYLNNGVLNFKSRLTFWLLILPIIGFFGSDGSFFHGIGHYIAFHLVLILTMDAKLDLEMKYLLPLLMGGVILYGYLFNPYANPPLLSQTKPISISNRIIYVSENTYNQYKEFEPVLKYVDARKSIINIGTPAGCLYLLNVNNYFTVYFNEKFSISRYLNLIKKRNLPDQVQLVYYKKSININFDTLEEELFSFQQFLSQNYTLKQKFDINRYTIFLYEKYHVSKKE